MNTILRRPSERTSLDKAWISRFDLPERAPQGDSSFRRELWNGSALAIDRCLRRVVSSQEIAIANQASIEKLHDEVVPLELDPLPHTT